MKKFICFIMSFIIFVGIAPTVYGAEKDNKSDVKAYVLMDMDSKTVLEAKNENERLSPASVTKIMSLLIIAEAIDNKKITLNDKVATTKDAVSKGGSQIWLELGEEMTVDELLKAVIIASANDACTALGDYVSGSQTAFVAEMNKKAKDLGLKNTNFENCTGLDDTTVNHYSSAYDLAIISSELMKHNLVQKYSTIWLDSLRDGKTELNNTNKLVNTYKGITGLKTGTTSNAGFCISATATRDNLNLVAVVLGADSSEKRFDTASQLLDTGFASYEAYSPKIDANKIKPVKVQYGIVKSVVPTVSKNISVTVKKGHNKISCKYDIKKSVNAPIKAGDSLGSVSVMCDGKVLRKYEITSPKSIKKVTFIDLFKQLIVKI